MLIPPVNSSIPTSRPREPQRAGNPPERAPAMSEAIASHRGQSRFEGSGAVASQSITSASGRRATDIEPPLDINHVPSDQELIQQINELRHDQIPYGSDPRYGGAPGSKGEIKGDLDAADQKLIAGLGADERRQFNATLYELRRLKRGEISSSEYMTNVMQHAVDIAGNDREKFVNLVQMSFNAADEDSGSPLHHKTVSQGQRWLAHGGENAGKFLEGIYRDMPARLDKVKSSDGNNLNDQFNPMVEDSEDRYNTVTHHFAEFLKSAFYEGGAVADQWVTANDSPDKNPGDVRNGYFAAMLGDALRNGKITPQDAVNLTRQAYSPDAGQNPPWGHDALADNGAYAQVLWMRTYTGYLDAGHYNIDDWLAAYDRQNPDEVRGASADF